MLRLEMLGDLERMPAGRGSHKQGWGNSMNNWWSKLALTATVGLAAVGVINVSAGRAADLPVKAPAPKTAAYSWTGCYIGGFAGWGQANDWNSTDLNGYNPAGANPWEFSLNTSVIYGGTAGCNWQAPMYVGPLQPVLGIEGEGGFMGLSVAPFAQPFPVAVGGGPTTVSDAAKIGNGYGVVASRIGLAFDRLLVYGKVGVAFYDATATITDTSNPGFFATGSKSVSTLAFGAGAEYAMWDHWTGKAEYLAFDGTSFNACNAFCWKQNTGLVSTFKLGLNYKFW
jgi:outer membrane immunogenic protein